jgi:hypothetical protein
MRLVLEKYKGFKLPEGSSSEEGKIWKRIHEWISICLSRKSVVATASDEHEYFKVYERYARNTANSAVARATRAGDLFHSRFQKTTVHNLRRTWNIYNKSLADLNI